MAKQGKAQTFLEYFAARTVFNFLRLLPVGMSMRCGKFVGRLTYLLARDLRRTGQRNLQLAFPEKTSAEREVLLRACFASLGRTLGLFSHFDRIQRDELLSLLDSSGLEHLEAAKKLGRGVILYTGHLGAWELSSFALSLLGHPLTFLVRRMDNPRVEELVDKSRTRFGNQTLDKLSAARAMLRTLQSGEVLGLLLDLNTLDEEAIFVDFFGVPAATNFMVAKLALRNNAPIIPVFAPWDATTKKFRLEIGAPIAVETTGNESEDVRMLTEKLSRTIEDEIRRYPDQWLWIHKRWKTRPPGERNIYN